MTQILGISYAIHLVPDSNACHLTTNTIYSTILYESAWLCWPYHRSHPSPPPNALQLSIQILQRISGLRPGQLATRRRNEDELLLR